MTHLPSGLAGAGLLALALGGWLVSIHHDRLDQVDWEPLTLELSEALSPGAVTRGEFRAGDAGQHVYEIELRFKRFGDAEFLNREALDFKKSPIFDVRWEVRSSEGDGVLVAGGDARDYLYLVRRDDWRHRLKLGLMRSPYGLDTVGHRTFGLAGVATASRGMGRFRLEPDENYGVIVSTTQGLEAFADYQPAVVVRPERRFAETKLAESAGFAYLGWLNVLAGGLLIAVAAIVGIRRVGAG